MPNCDFFPSELLDMDKKPAALFWIFSLPVSPYQKKIALIWWSDCMLYEFTGDDVAKATGQKPGTI